jgi:hypothetical protein
MLHVGAGSTVGCFFFSIFASVGETVSTWLRKIIHITQVCILKVTDRTPDNRPLIRKRIDIGGLLLLCPSRLQAHERAANFNNKSVDGKNPEGLY